MVYKAPLASTVFSLYNGFLVSHAMRNIHSSKKIFAETEALLSSLFLRHVEYIFSYNYFFPPSMTDQIFFFSISERLVTTYDVCISAQFRLSSGSKWGESYNLSLRGLEQVHCSGMKIKNSCNIVKLLHFALS